MGTRDPRIDAYIRKAAPFAQPILSHIRGIVHMVCADVEETMKWSFPHFDYKGEMMMSMAAFKGHCTFGFWKAPLLAVQGLIEAGDNPMGYRDRIESANDMPSDATLKKLIKAAMALNDKGLTVKRPKQPAKAAVKPPAYFMTALKKNKRALETYEAFSPSNRRDYVEWVTEAKSDETRDKRLTQAVAWMAEGKVRNWKYVRAN